ncbi:hypothetical protein EU805_16205 [Salipiger sp. IMCC34102]|uniref:hypothetical protein n=1 Tax=Salipiger sp. IMCC34102 TaxID=2510647 RepID=UPI00101BF2E9|nr:hypothetical protein [Salipiger sp. IMCC34102]RYH00998.1 hypothetical protein EU805_16205 [Salipiger sp. IMCC34102]
MALKDLFNVRAPALAPVGRRLAICAVLWGWTLFELAAGNLGWAVITGAAAAFCTVEFFILFDPDNYRDPDDG